MSSSRHKNNKVRAMKAEAVVDKVKIRKDCHMKRQMQNAKGFELTGTTMKSD